MNSELSSTGRNQPTRPVTDSSGKASPYPKRPDSTDPNTEIPFDELLRRKDQLGIYSPIRLIPRFRELIAVPFQKILIVRTEGIESLDLLRENNVISLQVEPIGNENLIPTPLSVRVVRVCEYANPSDEYRENGNPVPTNTILIEWQEINETGQQNAPFVTFVDDQKGIVLSSQVENLIIQDPPYNKPGPPIVTAAEDSPLPDGFFVENSDFNTHPPQGTSAVSTDSVVAVLDTGVKTRFKYDDGSITHQYPDSSQPSQMRSFKLATAPALIRHKHGYSPVTNYLRASNGVDPADQAYRTIPTLAALHTLSKEQILASPYDDHLLTNGQEVRGRHGTTLSAIINQKSAAAVLPVKIFNHGGQGTLYDLLCGLNYVLACHRSGLPVRVINLSLAGQLHYDAYVLLRAKFQALHNAGIWAVTAAGNRQVTADENTRRELKTNIADPAFDPSANINAREVWNLFPACFAGDPTLSVVTVTTVQESPYGLVALHLKKSNLFWSLLGVLLGTIFTLFKSPKNLRLTPVYKAANNYGKSFVSVGVIEPLTKVFQHANAGLKHDLVCRRLFLG